MATSKARVGAGLALAAVLGTALLVDASVRIKTQKDDRFKFVGVRTWAWHPDGAGEVKMALTPDDDPEATRVRVDPVITDAVTRAFAARRPISIARGRPRNARRGCAMPSTRSSRSSRKSDSPWSAR